MIKVSDSQIDERWNDAPDKIREAVFSQFYNDQFDGICDTYHLPENKRDILRNLVFYAFLGFFPLEDMYKEIKEGANLDPRIALDVYHDIDKKIFDPFKKEMEDMFIKFKIGIVKESQISTPEVNPQIVLREGPEVINLRPEPAVSEAPIKIKVEGEKKLPEPAPMSIGQVNIKPEAVIVAPASPKPPASSAAPISKLEAIISAPKPAPASAPDSEGPMIIHKKDESQSVVQTQPASPFRQTSFGGYMGTFRSFSGQAPQAPVSSAKIEIPSEQKISTPAGEQKIPVVVKKYDEEPVKTVHYSDLRTPLSPNKEEKPQSATVIPAAPIPPPFPPKKEPPQGMIDLTNLTFRK